MLRAVINNAYQMIQENPGVVTTMEDAMHGLEDGDHVTFKEIKGMAALNDRTCSVKGIEYIQINFSLIYKRHSGVDYYSIQINGKNF